MTVIDPGMMWSDSTERIKSALSQVGRRLGDIQQILITHGHPDHFGAAGWLAEEADASVICGRAELPKLIEITDRSELIDVVARLGIPDEKNTVFRSFYEGVRALIHPIGTERLALVDDAEVLMAGGREWQVHVTPGHSVGHVSLFDPEDRVLLSGDHLLACITPNPVLEPDVDSPDGRRRSLVEYLASLDRFIRLDPLLVLPGHGPRFCDVPMLTESTRRHHDHRANEIMDALVRLGEATPYELSTEIFPHIEDFSVMLSVSEVVGHLDLLEDDGRLHRSSELPCRYVSA
jgi:glyoxylase-like metal-dependent hydrolase (beta-lactamase superfamily II)